MPKKTIFYRDKKFELKPPSEFKIGSLERHFLQMKKIGRCPYDTFHEFSQAIIEGYDINRYKKPNERRVASEE